MKIFRSNSGRLITIFTLLLALDAIPVSSQEKNGGIEVKVTGRDSAEGIPGAKLTLLGPFTPVTPAILSKLYTPNPALTPEMKKQVDAMIASAPPDASADIIANEAQRLEARFLGLRLPLGPTLPPEVSVRTNSSGRGRFDGLEPGLYGISAQRDGYFGPLPPGSPETELPMTATTTVSVEVGKTSPEVHLALIFHATVSGKVLDSNGQPVRRAQVSAYRLVYQDLTTALQQVRSGTTDDRGEYRIFPLPPGEYYVGATPGSIDTSGRFQSSYTQTFFPDVIDARNANRVKVSEGSEVAGVDIGIRVSSTNIISGNSVNTSGLDGLIAWIFYLLRNDTGTLSNNKAPNTAADQNNGYFEFRGVAPGAYDVVASKINRITGVTAIGRTRIIVGSQDMESVVVNIQPDVEVKARLIVDGGPPLFAMVPPPESGVGLAIREDGTDIPMAFAPPVDTSPDSVRNLSVLGMMSRARQSLSTSSPGLVPYPTTRMQLRSMEFGAGLDNFGTLYPAVDPSGVFTFTSVPAGRYRIQTINLPENAYVADMRISEKSVYDDGFVAGIETGQIDVIVNSNGAQVQGTVRDAGQKPFPFGKIALVPTPSRRQNLALYKTAVSDSNGNFTVYGIAPGEYKLFAWDSARSNIVLNPDFIVDHETEGERITVREGGRITATLKLIPISLGP
jgi:protocatechuate 3,4-dioxygenase beta subunit